MKDLIELEAAVDPVRIPARARTELKCEIEVLSAASAPDRSAAPLETSICLLFDCSASMTGRKLQTSIDAAKAMVELLPARHRISLVGFHSRTRVLVDNARPSDGKLDEIKQQIDKIRSFVGGSTNLAAGIDHAVKILQSHPADARVVFMLTDGMADSPTKAQTAALEATRAGVQLFAVGMGNDYAADSLLDLVTPSNGAVFGEHDLDKITATFAHLLGRVESFVATNARLAIAFDAGVEVGAAYKTRPERAFLGRLTRDADGSVQINVGNIEAGRRYGFLVVAGVTPGRGGPYEVARATLTYDGPGVRARRTEVAVRVVVAEDGAVTGNHEVAAAFRGARAAQLVQAIALANRARDARALRPLLDDLLRIAEEAGDERLAKNVRAILARAKVGVSIPPDMLNALVLGSSAARTEDVTEPTVRAAAARRPATPAPPPPLPQRAETAAHPTLADLVLLDAGESLILVIREVRAATGLALREVTDLVRAAPGAVWSAAPRADAEALRQRLERAGAKVELRPHR